MKSEPTEREEIDMPQLPNRSDHPPDVVGLMRGPITDLGRDPSNALRLVFRLGGSLDMLLTQARRCLDLSGSELDAVLAMWEAGRCTMTELGRRTAMSRAAITTLTDRLERKGYVTRLPDPTDRRRVLVTITPKLEQDLFATTTDFAAALSKDAAHNPDEWNAFATTAERPHARAREHTDLLRPIADVHDAADTPTRKQRAKLIEPLNEHW